MREAKRKVIVVGALGMLGQDVVPAMAEAGYEVLALDAREAQGEMLFASGLTDITKRDSLISQFKELSPDVVVNCAAYTNVDSAEKDYETAFEINALGVENLALACAKVGALLVHISTDYVFGGGAQRETLSSPLSEDHLVSPCGLYGYSKFLGEVLLRNALPESHLPESHLIVRTSWLHGTHGNNFIHTMLRLGRELPELKIVSDQIGSPTYAYWLARVLVKLIAKDARGTFHASSKGGISWYRFAEEIFKMAGIKVSLKEQTSEQLGRPAPRPPYSTLSLARLEETLGLQVPSWQEGLEAHLRSLGEFRAGEFRE